MLYTEQLDKQVMAQKPNVREKIKKDGVTRLSNLELIMLMIGSGTRQFPVAKLAKRVLDEIIASDNSTLGDNLRRIKGIGESKSALITAAFEFGRRMNGIRGKVITKASDIIPLIGHYALEFQEHFLCITLNGAHELQKIRLISVGTLTRSLIHPREIFADAVIDRAAAVIVCHNHPSGNSEPSVQDIEATNRLKNASEILGINLLDHIVFTNTEYFSFHDQKLL